MVRGKFCLGSGKMCRHAPAISASEQPVRCTLSVRGRRLRHCSEVASVLRYMPAALHYGSPVVAVNGLNPRSAMAAQAAAPRCGNRK